MNNTLKPLSRKEISLLISEKVEVPAKKIIEILDVYEQLLIEELQRVKVFKFGNIGRFKIVTKKDRFGYNPITDEKMYIAARSTPKFSFKQQVKIALENAFQVDDGVGEYDVDLDE